MNCRGCDSNFRTINIPDNKTRICYKCGFDNGKVCDEKKEGENED